MNFCGWFGGGAERDQFAPFMSAPKGEILKNSMTQPAGWPSKHHGEKSGGGRDNNPPGK
jgi:hypothetical protein